MALWSFHPRIRGARGLVVRPEHSRILSSPHSAGEQGLRDPRSFIPAYAGKRRLCHFAAGLPSFIPAYAGHTLNLGAKIHDNTFHPRIRGAHSISLISVGHVVLSSPHTRGTPHPRTAGACCRTFIPAYTGHTTCRGAARSTSSFHPRIRGAHVVMPAALWALILSSPHTRGTRLHTQEQRVRCPFIPAYAGHTPSSGRGRTPSAFHPRIRGAHNFSRDRHGDPPLSSPRSAGHTMGLLSLLVSPPFHPRITRGRRPLFTQKRICHAFIPA